MGGEQHQGLSFPEREVSRQEWEAIHLKHFLVEHTADKIDEIGEALNESMPELVYLEFLGLDMKTRQYTERLMQRVIDKEINLEEYLQSIGVDPNEAHEDLHFRLIASIRFPCEIKLIDISDEDMELMILDENRVWASVTEDRFEEAYNHYRSLELETHLRESLIIDQLTNDLGARACANEAQRVMHVALVTGAAHSKVSMDLKKLGVEVKRKFIVEPGTDYHPEFEGELIRHSPYNRALRTYLFLTDGEKSRGAFKEAYVIINLQNLAFSQGKDWRAVAKDVKRMSDEQLYDEIVKIDSRKTTQNKSKLGRIIGKLLGKQTAK